MGNSMGTAISRISNKLLTTALSMPKDAVVQDVRVEIKWTSESCPRYSDGTGIETREGEPFVVVKLDGKV